MSKISARDIEVFVAGVIAYVGIETLRAAGTLIILYPQAFHTVPYFIIADFILGALGLLLGIAMFAGVGRALRWAQGFLWFLLVLNVGGIGFRILKALGIGETLYIRLNDGIFGFLCSLALLSLIAWSRSMRFRYSDSDTEDTLLNVRRSGFVSRISARDIQVFVAGVISYLGFYFLSIAANLRDTSTEASGVVRNFIIGAVCLLFGFSIAAGNMRALRWVHGFLWFILIVKSFSIFPNPHLPKKSPISLYYNISSFFTCGALLWLVVWSRSKRFGSHGLAQRLPDHEDG
jgi:hypothetical protein